MFVSSGIKIEDLSELPTTNIVKVWFQKGGDRDIVDFEAIAGNTSAWISRSWIIIDGRHKITAPDAIQFSVPASAVIKKMTASGLSTLINSYDKKKEATFIARNMTKLLTTTWYMKLLPPRLKHFFNQSLLSRKMIPPYAY